MVEALTRGKEAVEVGGKDARTIGMIIKKGVTLKTRIEVTKEAIAANNQRLLPYAEELASSTGMKSATFRCAEGTATVKFGEGIRYDPDDMDAIKEILGPVFTQMFHEVPSFAVNPADIPEIKKKLGKDFDRLVQVQHSYSHTKELRNLLTDGDSPTARKLRDYVYIESKKPSFSFERAAD